MSRVRRTKREADKAIKNIVAYNSSAKEEKKALIKELKARLRIERRLRPRTDKGKNIKECNIRDYKALIKQTKRELALEA